MRRRPEYLAHRFGNPLGFGETAVLVHTKYGFDRDGNWVEMEEERTELAIASQPATDEDMKMLEMAGVRVDGARRFWSPVAVQTVTDASVNDVLEYDEQQWRVFQVRQWPSHYEFFASLVYENA